MVILMMRVEIMGMKELMGYQIAEFIGMESTAMTGDGDLHRMVSPT